MAQHKWHKEIKAWADGGEVEFYDPVTETWELIEEPLWWDKTKYRIKPQPKEPQYLYVHRNNEGNIEYAFSETVSIVGYFYIGKIKLEVEDHD